MKSSMFGVLFGSLALVSAAAGSVYAESDGACTITDAKLICAESIKDGQAVLDAMSNPKTLATLQGAFSGKKVFDDGDERENFRLSLEANRRAMTKFADKKWRSYRRKKITADVYEAIREQYRAGMKAYWEGMKLYRAGTWHSDVKPYQSD